MESLIVAVGSKLTADKGGCVRLGSASVKGSSVAVASLGVDDSEEGAASSGEGVDSGTGAVSGSAVDSCIFASAFTVTVGDIEVTCALSAVFKVLESDVEAGDAS